MCFSEGVVLLENPKGDNILDVERLKTVCCSVFGLNGAPVAIFNGKTGEIWLTDTLQLQTDGHNNQNLVKKWYGVFNDKVANILIFCMYEVYLLCR